MASPRPSRRWKIVLVLVGVYLALALVQVPLWRWLRTTYVIHPGTMQPMPGAPWPSDERPSDLWPKKPADVRQSKEGIFTRTSASSTLYIRSDEPRLANGFADGVSAMIKQEVLEVGWPRRVWIEERIEDPSPFRIPNPRADMVLHRIHWEGLLINAAIFAIPSAALCWLALAAWQRQIARRRVAKGLCPTCAYPRGSSPVCSECGHAFATR